MTTTRASLQRELEQWERNLLSVTDEDIVAAGPDQLMAAVQTTLVAYRHHILPVLGAGQGAAAAPYDVIADEVARTVDRLEDLRRDLVAGGRVDQLRRQLDESLAVLRALTRVAVRLRGYDAGRERDLRL
jgi:hypothetical protein